MSDVAASDGGADRSIDDGNAISVSWGDHLEWGRGDAALRTPDHIARSVARWRAELSAGTLLWREHRTVRQLSRFFRDPHATTRSLYTGHPPVDMDEHRVVIDAARSEGMRPFVYTTILDEGWPLEIDQRGQLEARQSTYVLFNRHHQLVDRRGEPHHGVLCLAEPEVRAYLVGKVEWLVAENDWDGVFICTRSQSRPAGYGDLYGFNRPIVDEYRRRHGVDILVEDFDLETWRRIQGEGLTLLLAELRSVLAPRGIALSVGIPRADYLGPPVGNVHLDWRAWMSDGIVDELVIDQVAAVCPSTRRTIWPRASGYGYLDNHVGQRDRSGLPEDVREVWGPAATEHGVPLYLARMWDDADPAADHALRKLPGVRGLVHSSFRFERDRGASHRGLWPG